MLPSRDGNLDIVGIGDIVSIHKETTSQTYRTSTLSIEIFRTQYRVLVNFKDELTLVVLQSLYLHHAY